jgi:hypothetical protein
MGRFYTVKKVDPEKLTQLQAPSIHSVVTIEGDTVAFDPVASLQDSTVSGFSMDSTAVEIPLARVHYANIRKIDDLKLLASCAAGLLGAAIGLVLGIWLVIWMESKN